MLVEEIVSEIVSERHLPPVEVRAWRWIRLERTYQQVYRTIYERDMGSVRTQEIAIKRALAEGFGGKRLPALPKLDDADLPFKPKVRVVKGGMMDKYIKANKLKR